MYFKLILVMLIVGAIGGGYAYHQVTVTNLENQVIQLDANNRTLKENQIQMEIAVSTAQQTIQDMEANRVAQEAAMSDLTQRNNQLNREKQNYMKIFKDHNLTRLARAKPGMIETRINNGTEKVFRMLENDTKELMDADDGEPVTSGLPTNAQTGVGSEAGDNSTGTTDSNSDGKSTAENLSTSVAAGN